MSASVKSGSSERSSEEWHWNWESSTERTPFQPQPDDGAPTSSDGLPPGHFLPIWAAPLLACLSLALWLWGLSPMSPDELDGFGLIKHLSPVLLLAYPCLAAAGVTELVRGRPRGWVLTLVTVLALLLVYGLQPAIYDEARLPVAWLHAGFVEQIADSGRIIHNYDTRFSWPGFFTSAAFLGKAAGLPTVVPLLKWAPLVLASLATLGMRALAQATLGAGRAGWLATWLFLLADWTEQEYFSPQGLAMVLLLAALAVAVRFLVAPGLTEGGRVLPWRRVVPASTGRQRIFAQVFVLVIAVALAPTHQLTPYVLVGMLGVMYLWGRLYSPWLPLLALVPPAAWFALGAKEFWAGQLSEVTGGIGAVNQTFGQGISDRLVGDAGHQSMVALRIALSVLMAALAVIGLLVLRRQGVRTWVLPALAASAFVMALLQPYGGEIFVRCYLFALPWFAIGAAVALEVLLARRPRRASWSPARRLSTQWRPAVAALLLTFIGLQTVSVRGGNDAYLAFTSADVNAINYVYAHAKNKSIVTILQPYAIMRSSRVANLNQQGVDALDYNGKPCDDPATMPACINDTNVSYVMLSPQQARGATILDAFPPDWMKVVSRQLIEKYHYSVAFSQDGRVVLAARDVKEKS